MTPNIQQEKFSEAYVRAIAAVAGFSASTPGVDDDSIDMTIATRSNSGSVCSPRLDIQLKSASDIQLKADRPSFSFRIPIKNYDDLRNPRVMIPRLLVVVRVPRDQAHWTESTEEQLIMRHCGYWVSLRNAPDIPNTDNRTVTIPRHQLFTVDSLKDLMDRIGQREMP
ncbi:MAG: DUF4365 domain-containing protein [Magnetococcales bacterium]|nr:DUF4365 domain-containing protein [Magnetococcales bacterium]